MPLVEEDSYNCNISSWYILCCSSRNKLVEKHKQPQTRRAGGCLGVCVCVVPPIPMGTYDISFH